MDQAVGIGESMVLAEGKSLGETTVSERVRKMMLRAKLRRPHADFTTVKMFF